LPFADWAGKIPLVGIEKLVRKPLTPDQAGMWAELYMAIVAPDEDDDILGEDDLAEQFADPRVDYERGSIAVYDGDVMVGYCVLESKNAADPVHEMRQNGAVRVEYRGRGIGSELLQWSEQVAPILHEERFPGKPLALAGGSLATNASALALFADHGYVRSRWFNQMTRDLSADVEPPVLPEAVEIAEFSDSRSADALLIRNEAFRDHWAPDDMTPESWALHLRSNSFRPAYSFVAYLNGQPAGIIIANEYGAYNETKGLRDLYIPQVATRRAGRKRGIASALLATTLTAAQADGFNTATLTVDADSPTGAVGLYERVGFVVSQTAINLRKVLSEG
jgi:GNAT superfamily N-acetyltransferase